MVMKGYNRQRLPNSWRTVSRGFFHLLSSPAYAWGTTGGKNSLTGFFILSLKFRYYSGYQFTLTVWLSLLNVRFGCKQPDTAVIGHHRCQCHRWQSYPGVVDTGGKITPGIDPSGKFAAGNNDTSGQSTTVSLTLTVSLLICKYLWKFAKYRTEKTLTR